MLIPYKYLCGFCLNYFMEKEILGYENYTIDENGRIFNKRKNKYIKPFVNKYGYPAVYLCANGKRKYFLIHRLVAITFIPNPNNYKEVNHKDENTKNANVENLEWCTRKYNNNYGKRIDRCIEKLGKKVLCVESGEIFRSIRDVERKKGISASAVCMVCNGKRKTAGGFKWKFC